MDMAPVTTEDKAGKAVLYARFVELLPAARARCGGDNVETNNSNEASEEDQNLELLLDLLGGMRKLVSGSAAAHQALFRHARVGARSSRHIPS